MNKLLVIGLDCVPPELMFPELFATGSAMPDPAVAMPFLETMEKLKSESFYGSLKSTAPPVTVPAWTSMFTGVSPGELGIYGFRNRLDWRFPELFLTDSKAITYPRIWDISSKVGLSNILLGVPQTYPPEKVNGLMVSGFLSPGENSQFTYPPELKENIHHFNRESGGYRLDIKDFRNMERGKLVSEIYDITKIRFSTFRHLLNTREWDMAYMVEIGTDRLHHGFWSYWDRNHPGYVGNNGYEKVIPDYYSFLDSQISGLLSSIDLDSTNIVIVSDHGARPMKGAFAVNEWLVQEGYLNYKGEEVDWSRTSAWGEAGYYSRIYINLKDREMYGIVPETQYSSLRDEIRRKLESLVLNDGTSAENRCLYPEEIYPETLGIPPDIMLYAGNLSLRCVSSVGMGLFPDFNDNGPDGANHSEEGIVLIRPAGGLSTVCTGKADILDIAPTILSLSGINIPGFMKGKVIV